MTIRTPDQRLRVFVSSTLQELSAERKAGREAIERLRLTPVMFELGARPHPPRALYRAYLEQSDVFVGIYWQQYGWVAPGETISGLEDEYDLARHRPKLIYLRKPAPEREPRLAALLDRIRADDQASYRSFSSPDELRDLIADDLAVLLTERFSSAVSPEVSSPLATPGQFGSLPAPLTRLIGRESEVALVSDLLRDAGCRLVTLVGPGGIGKTRIALALAARIRDRYPDGICYVELAPVTESELVVPTIAHAVGLREGGGMSVGVALRRAVADRRMLLVLDNMEQLTNAGPQLSDLLTAAQGLQLLVTSRTVLNLTGERVVRVDPLPVPAADAVAPDDVYGSHAVELFLDRAAAVRPGFVPSRTSLDAIAEIVRRLDGLPLAIELASARLKVLPPEALLARMGYQRLDLLHGGARDLPARQQALRATIAWSHSLLTRDEQLLFARLGVFVGSADLEAIEAVANRERSLSTVDLVASLLDKSLVRTVESRGAEARFGMLETIREFAVEQLEASGASDDLRTRHQEYYLELARAGEHGLGTPDQLEWLARLTREQDNFRAALRRALRRGDVAAWLALCRTLATFWQIRGALTEGRRWIEEGLRLEGVSPYQRAVAMTLAGVMAFWQGDLERIQQSVGGLSDTLSGGPDRRAFGFARFLDAFAGDPWSDEALASVNEAVAVLGSDEEPLVRAVALLIRAYTPRVHGRFEEMADLASQALTLADDIGDNFVGAVAASMLASVAIVQRQAEEARRHALTVIRGWRRLGNEGNVAWGLELLGAAELVGDDPATAGRLWGLAAAYRDRTRTRRWKTETELYLLIEAELHARLGDRYAPVMDEGRRASLDSEIAAAQERAATARRSAAQAVT